MIVEKVTVRLGRTIPGPEYGGGQFANVKPEVEITVRSSQTVNTPQGLQELTENATRAAQAQLRLVEGMLIKQALGQQVPPPANMNNGGVHQAVIGQPPAPPQLQQPAVPQQVAIPQVSQPTW